MRVLAYVSPARGHLYPIITTLIELQKRQHKVVVRALASEVERLRSLGFDASPIDPRVEAREMDDWRGGNQLQQIQRALAAFVDRARYEVEELPDLIAHSTPHLLLVDVNSWGAQAVAEASGLPWAVFAPYPLPIPSRDAPPFGMGLRPMKGPLGRLRDFGLLRLSLLGWNSVLPTYNQVRRSAGAPALSSVVDLFGRAPLTLSYTAEPLEYPRSDWPSSVQRVGPSTWEPQSALPARLAQIDRPVILVTTSTEFQSDVRLIEVALEALADLPYTVVVTCPTGVPGSLRVPGNARVENFVPHGPILAMASCVVCHGGIGITQKALAAGVPVCVVPFGRDQPEVARRVEVAGAGTRLPAGRLSPIRLRKAVLAAIELKPGAERVARGFRLAGGAPRAADALEAAAATSLSGAASGFDSAQ